MDARDKPGYDERRVLRTLAERLDGALCLNGVAGERYLPSGLAMVDR